MCHCTVLDETRVLVPVSQTHVRRGNLQATGKRLRELLHVKSYNNIGEFLLDSKLMLGIYYNIICATSKRSKLFFKHYMRQVFTNTYHSWVH